MNHKYRIGICTPEELTRAKNSAVMIGISDVLSYDQHYRVDPVRTGGIGVAVYGLRLGLDQCHTVSQLGEGIRPIVLATDNDGCLNQFVRNGRSEGVSVDDLIWGRFLVWCRR